MWPMRAIHWQRADGGEEEIQDFIGKVAVFCLAYPEPIDDSERQKKFYDRWAQDELNDRSAIAECDITAANQFAARTSWNWWQGFHQPLPTLEEVGTDWQLFDQDDEWEARKQALKELLKSVMQPHISWASATKVLHLKRPAFIPICDSIVVNRVLGNQLPPEKWEVALETTRAIREIGINHRKTIREAQQYLQDHLEPDYAYASLSEVRVLDAAIWFDTEARRAHWTLLG